MNAVMALTLTARRSDSGRVRNLHRQHDPRRSPLDPIAPLPSGSIERTEPCLLKSIGRAPARP